MKLFVKFGEKKYIDRIFLYNRYYFSCAKRYHDIETAQQIKGQGDKTEACMVAHASNVVLEARGIQRSFSDVDMNILLSQSARLPVFCITQVDTERDCVEENGLFRLSHHLEDVIRSHFPKADTALIIFDSKLFIDCFTQQLGVVEHELVRYVPKDSRGITKEWAEAVSRPVEFEEYSKKVNQSTMGMRFELDNQPTTYRLVDDKAKTLALFCKDPFFQDEQEYRFVLRNKTIPVGSDGKEFTVRFPKFKMKEMPLDQLFHQYSFHRG